MNHLRPSVGRIFPNVLLAQPLMIVGRPILCDDSSQQKMITASAATSIPKGSFRMWGSLCLEKAPLPNLVWLIRTQVILLIDLLSLDKNLLGGVAESLGI